jgi:hypothetical protein
MIVTVTIGDQAKQVLLKHGYLPNHLPPLFSSVGFAGAASQIDRTLQLRADGRKPWTEPVRFSAARLNGLRRRMAMPNPYSFLRLADEIGVQWTTLDSHWKGSTLSVSRPRYESTAKGLSNSASFHEREQRRLAAATRARFRLNADIAQCYASIYTHALSWALTNKPDSKLNLSNPSWPGALLDRLLREAQDGQTVGVPIGPDSSLVAAETILCAVDQRLQAHSNKWIDAFRAIDDYEIFVAKRSDAEDLLNLLQTELSDFELGLNASKTFIDEAPFLLEAPWKSTLMLTAPTGSLLRAAKVRAFANEVFDLAQRYPGDAVINYALRIADSLDCTTTGHKILIDVALATLRFSPPSIRYALRSIMNRLQKMDMDRAALWTCLNEMITEGARIGNSYEVTWGLWALLVSDGKVDAVASAAAAAMDDPFSLTAYMRMTDLHRTNGDFPARLTQMGSESLTECSDAWILAYEAYVRGWAKPGSLPTSPFFDRLKDLNVSFIDDAVVPLALSDDAEEFDPADFDIADLGWFEAGYE